MARRFEPAGHGLADSIGGHEQPLFEGQAGAEELDLFGVQLAPVWPGIRKHRHEGRLPALPFRVHRFPIEQTLHPLQV
jgi:hypothetical protein